MSHGSTKKDRKTKEFPRIEGQSLRCGEKAIRVKPVDDGDADMSG